MAATEVAIGADLPKEGRYDYTACWSGVSTAVEFSKANSAFSYEMTGTIRSNQPEGLFDKSTFRCVGANAVLAGKPSALAVCEGLDRDGDKRLTYFTLGSDGKFIREHVAGTGKYEGMVVSGTVENLGPFPAVKPGTFQDCNRQTGTYKMK